MAEFTNTLYTQDNLFILTGMNSNLVDLIYLDPPFNSKRLYAAPVGTEAAGTSFKDMWTWTDVDEAYLDTLADKYPALARFISGVGKIHSKDMMAYLTYMAQRIIEMHRVLKDTGSLYLHCDPTAGHYLKILLDEVFGKNNFKNEIIWHYRRWTGKAKRFQELHDIIYFYSKSNDYTFNVQYTNYTEGSISRKKGGKLHRFKKGHETVLVSDKEIDEKGVRENDVWHIPFIAPSAKERTGYPTQKPLALLHRIIKASSNEGDIVLDPFCGCATTCVAAQQLGRKWIGIDLEKQAVRILVDRLKNDSGLFADFINTAVIPQRTDITTEQPSASVKERLYKEQNGLCNACGTKFDLWNLEIDHIIPKAKGGGDYYENYQLLCGSCNKIKGDRPMEYLRLKIKTREEMLENKIIFGE
jgi:site-specific DNA-methyltransferase (adenine-specific)